VIVVDDGRAQAGVEDDYHHFRMSMAHDGRHVTVVEGEAVRFPWATCPGASAMLRSLVGTPIETAVVRHPDAFDRFNQCTHQLELALLAIAQVARGASRCFDVTITGTDAGRMRVATVERDGVLVEEWRLAGDELLAPPNLAGVNVRKLRPWANTLDDDRYEGVAILRRCLQVSSRGSRTVLPQVASHVPGSRNACYAFQDVRAELGRFVPESPRDFSDSPDELLREFR